MTSHQNVPQEEMYLVRKMMIPERKRIKTDRKPLVLLKVSFPYLLAKNILSRMVTRFMTNVFQARPVAPRWRKRGERKKVMEIKKTARLMILIQTDM